MSEPKQVLSPGGDVWATAPDDTWLLRGEEWPALGVRVEACWASRFKDPPTYGYAYASLKQVDPPSSTWVNEAGQELIFNPDFWRPIQTEA